MSVVTKSLKAFAVAAVSATVLAGCANRDHIQVGSVPDDYRTRHPMVIAEQPVQMMVPLPHSPRAFSHDEKSAIAGFLSGYRNSGSGPIIVSVPAHAGNAAAAANAARNVADVAASLRLGAPVQHTAYQPHANDTSPPLIVSYNSLKATAGPCGRWPEDIQPTADNKQYENFGCAYQNNLARQIANPMDLLTPRQSGQIDADNRQAVIDGYRTRPEGSVFTPNINY